MWTRRSERETSTAGRGVLEGKVFEFRAVPVVAELSGVGELYSCSPLAPIRARGAFSSLVPPHRLVLDILQLVSTIILYSSACSALDCDDPNQFCFRKRGQPPGGQRLYQNTYSDSFSSDYISTTIANASSLRIWRRLGVGIIRGGSVARSLGESRPVSPRPRRHQVHPFVERPLIHLVIPICTPLCGMQVVSTVIVLVSAGRV